MQIGSLAIVKYSIKKKLLHYLGVIPDVKACNYLIQLLKSSGEKNPSVLKKTTRIWLPKTILQRILKGTVRVNTPRQNVLKENLDIKLGMWYSCLCYFLDFSSFSFCSISDFSQHLYLVIFCLWRIAKISSHY